MLGRYIQLCFMAADENMPLFDETTLFGTCKKLTRDAPRIQFIHGNLVWNSQNPPGINYETNIQPYENKKIIFLARNIPDVLVSHFWHFKTRSSSFKLNSLSDFIRDPDYGVEKICRFYELWHDASRSIKSLHLIRYEDLKVKAKDELNKILKFLNIPVENSCINEAIQFSSFNKMRDHELENQKSEQFVYKSSGFSVFATGDTDKNKEAFHTRKGIVGGYKEYMTQEDIDYLKMKLDGRVAEWFGYPNGFPDSTHA